MGYVQVHGCDWCRIRFTKKGKNNGINFISILYARWEGELRGMRNERWSIFITHVNSTIWWCRRYRVRALIVFYSIIWYWRWWVRALCIANLLLLDIIVMLCGQFGYFIINKLQLKLPNATTRNAWYNKEQRMKAAVLYEALNLALFSQNCRSYSYNAQARSQEFPLKADVTVCVCVQNEVIHYSTEYCIRCAVHFTRHFRPFSCPLRPLYIFRVVNPFRIQ